MNSHTRLLVGARRSHLEEWLDRCTSLSVASLCASLIRVTLGHSHSRWRPRAAGAGLNGLRADSSGLEQEESGKLL